MKSVSPACSCDKSASERSGHIRKELFYPIFEYLVKVLQAFLVQQAELTYETSKTTGSKGAPGEADQVDEITRAVVVSQKRVGFSNVLGESQSW